MSISFPQISSPIHLRKSIKSVQVSFDEVKFRPAFCRGSNPKSRAATSSLEDKNHGSPIPDQNWDREPLGYSSSHRTPATLLSLKREPSPIFLTTSRQKGVGWYCICAL